MLLVLIMYVHVCLSVDLNMCVQWLLRLEGAGFPKLELDLTVSHHVDAGNWARVLYIYFKCPNH